MSDQNPQPAAPEPAAPEPAAPTDVVYVEAPPRVRRPPTRWVGVWSLALAVVLLAAEIAAIVLASSGSWGTATLVAWAVIVLGGVTFLLGLVAVILRRGRAWGVAAMVLSVVANPLVLVWLFGVLGNS